MLSEVLTSDAYYYYYKYAPEAINGEEDFAATPDPFVVALYLRLTQGQNICDVSSNVMLLILMRYVR